MKLDTHQVILACYESLRAEHPRTPVEAKDLAQAFAHDYLIARNGLIERVGDWLYARWGLNAAAWFDEIVYRIDNTDSAFADLWMSGDMDESNPEEVAMATCYGIAVLLFWRSEDRGWVHYAPPKFTEEDAAAWLAAHATPVLVQRSLFDLGAQ